MDENKSSKTPLKRAALHNLGCKVNAYENDIMRRALEEKGYTIEIGYNPRIDYLKVIDNIYGGNNGK